MGRQKELAKNTAILTFGKICTQCISFFLLPLYTAVLDTSEYGLFDLMITYGTLLIPIVNWQFDQGLFRFLIDVRGNKEKQTEIFSSVFTANIVQAALFVLIMALVSIVSSFKYSIFLTTYIVLHVFVALLLQFVRGLGKSTVYAVASFISAVTTVALNALTLVVFKLGLSGLFLATIAAQIATLVYLLVASRVYRYFKFKSINKNTYREVRKYSLPLIPNNLAWWVVNVSDRTIVSYVLGVAANGIYTVANKFSNVFINFYNIFNLTWTETVSLHYQDEDRDVFLSDTMTTLYKMFSCACFGVVALMPYIFPIMVHFNYAEAYPQIIILMYAMLLRVIVGLYSCVYIAMKDSKKVATTSGISALINIVINLLLINKIGLYAASISTFVAFGAMAIVRYFDINRILKMKIKRSVLISSIFIGCALAVTYYINLAPVNLGMLAVVVVYSFVMNIGIINSAIKMVHNFLVKK